MIGQRVKVVFTRFGKAPAPCLSRALLLLLIAAAAGGWKAASAADFCVANDNEFALAAITAQFAPTTIELVQGTYHVDGTVFDDTQTTFQSFSLLGGYAPGCATRDIDPTNTTIQATGALGIVAELVGDVTIEGIRFDGPGGALYLDWTDFDHDIASFVQVNIRRNIFRGLQYGVVVNWVPSGSQTLDARIVNNLMHDNGNSDATACNGLGDGTLNLGAVEDSDATFTVINNTIVDNSLGGGICYGYAGRLLAYNNILYGNTGPDLSTANGTNALLIDNLFQTHNYHGIVTELGTLDTDPRLDGSFRPIESPPSPVIDSGFNNVHGGLPSHDLDGGPRIVGSAVDRGAYESSINDEFLQTVTNTSDAGAGSLRSAIASANANGSGLITFDLGTGCGPHVITLTSPLPAITAPIIVNGYSQPGSSSNDLDVGDDASLCVVLEAGNASVTRGLVVPASAGDGVSLFAEGLAFSNFSDTAIDLAAGSGHLIVGNRFGGNASGHALLPNGIGVQLDAAAHDSTVGGDDNGARNILGSSTGSGIALFQGTHDNQIVGNLIGVAAFLALPSVILVLIFGQTRIFFVMSRDGLLPEVLSRVHPKFRTPHVVTLITGIGVAFAAAFFPVGSLADISNAGTLYAFLMVAVAVLMLRKNDPNRQRNFRVPGVWIVAPLTILGCLFLFLNLPTAAMLFLPGWSVLGLIIYFAYSRSKSQLGRGIVEVIDEVGGEDTMVPIHPPHD